MCVCIVAPAENARVGQVVREKVSQPVDTVVRRPRLLAVSVQTMDCDDTTVWLAANAQRSDRKHTQWLGWCLQLPLASHVQLQQLPLLTPGMQRVLQESPCVLVRVKRKPACEMYLRLALLRADTQAPSHRVDSG
jgi:hypothetical protein